MTRKLATVRAIEAIDPIPGADAIEVATVGGWKVVVKKGEYAPGDLAIYVEIDSWVPYDLAPFLCKGKEPRVYEGVPGERLRTVKLRGQISQGLLLPLYKFPATEKAMVAFHSTRVCMSLEEQNEAFDVTDILGIQKYEKPLPAQLTGHAKGFFPSFIKKTDQERCQNLKRDIQQAVEAGEVFEVTYKLDGSSFTAYVNWDSELSDLVVGVCSRNLELKLFDEANADNTFIRTFRKYNLEQLLRDYSVATGRLIAIQGEMVGPGIQSNFEGLDDVELYVFNVYDIKTQSYILPKEARAIVTDLGLNYVPVFKEEHTLTESVEELLEMANGPSGLNGKYREGLVFKSLTRDFSFKAISNNYLLKSND